jgi:hypothetical protein
MVLSNSTRKLFTDPCANNLNTKMASDRTPATLLRSSLLTYMSNFYSVTITSDLHLT